MPRAIRLEVKHVRYVNGKPQVRIRVPNAVREILGKKEVTQFLTAADTRRLPKSSRASSGSFGNYGMTRLPPCGCCIPIWTISRPMISPSNLPLMPT
jgi:hypothetical protein